MYLLPDSKNTLTVEAEQKPSINSVNKDMLISVNKKERETNENNNVLEEPGNEISSNNDHLNQIGIPPSFEKHDNGMIVIFVGVFGYKSQIYCLQKLIAGNKLLLMRSNMHGRGINGLHGDMII